MPRFLADLRAEPLVDDARVSAFRVLDWHLFQTMSAADVQQILSRQAILLTRCPANGSDFQDSLDAIGPPELLIEVEGITWLPCFHFFVTDYL